ncbi:hypothetical protein [Brevibacillus sp. SYSU BS000544]|uniref:hypothetical protein n=1 Tax=Brevibacillus sp. SYSU BS000544 TaxID=3416443 RepID=UPI003CE4AD77
MLSQFQKSYQLITEELALFNEEYYLSVWCMPLQEYSQEQRDSLFHALFDFDCADLELQVDVSEESRDIWYVQFLIPYMFTTTEQAEKRLQRGTAFLIDHMQESGFQLSAEPLKQENIYHYLKRYNPELV